MEALIRSEQKLTAFAEDFLAGISPAERATVVGLEGDLGAGKTSFVKAVAAVLGIEETVQSPTFVIEKIYKLSGQRWEHLIHIDAYRLESPDELAQLGWEEVLADPGNLVLLEWPERVERLMPPDARRLFFTFVDDTTRNISDHA